MSWEQVHTLDGVDQLVAAGAQVDSLEGYQLVAKDMRMRQKAEKRSSILELHMLCT